MENENLYIELKKLKKKDYIYYNQSRFQVNFENLTNPQLDDDEIEAWKFIKNYFSKGRKESILKGDLEREIKNSGKHVHTVILYMLGCYLKDIVNEKLKLKLLEIISPEQLETWYEFSYSWFLSCLYHDVTTKIERDIEKLNEFEHYDNSTDMFKAVCKKFKIDNLFFENKAMKNHYSYKVETYKEYLYYRIKSKSIDHGILGGLLLYDRLYKNYYDNYEAYKLNVNNFESEKHFNYNQVNWRIEHLDHFAYIADSIASHNIWHKNKEEFMQCKGINIENLIELTIDKDSKIFVNSHPLTYFLGVFDTVEPSKRFSGLTLKKVLKQIKIIYDKELKKIIINSNIDLTKMEAYEKWIKGIEDLELWLNLKVDSSIDKEVIINIKD